ncbi:MAG: heparan N-sulfatase, partial [Bacteroidota bacterium]
PFQWYADCDGGPTKNYMIENKDQDEEHQKAYQLAFAKRPAEELYDLKSDLGQVNNVAADAQYKEVLEAMRGKMEAKLIALNDPRAANPNYDGFNNHPYLGGAGGKIPQRLRKED